MATLKHNENYPTATVILSNLVSLPLYGSGFFILFKLCRIYSILYVIYILVLEFRIIRYHCINCYYWGKTCGFGKGRLSALFFKQGNPADFCNANMTWKSVIPDMLVSVIPIITGIVLLILEFDILILTALILLILLTSFGNGFVRGKLTCKYCKQRKLGCPAEKLFNKEV